MNRRTLLGSTLLAIATRPLIWPRWISAARAGDRNWRHGVSFFDDLKYPAGFGHFEYVNPDSPKAELVKIVEADIDVADQITDEATEVAASRPTATFTTYRWFFFPVDFADCPLRRFFQ
jgi:ABC-type oligopeptide transport system substrate-binding subunit